MKNTKLIKQKSNRAKVTICTKVTHCAKVSLRVYFTYI